VQGLKPLALSSPSCVSLNGFYKKIKFPVFEWRERGRVSSLLVGLERRDAHARRSFPGNAFIGGCQKLPHRISLSGALSAGEREAWSPALVGAVQVWKDGFVTSFVSSCRLLLWRSQRTVTSCIHFWSRAPRLNHRRQQSTCCCRLTHSISMLDRAACGLRVEGGRRSAGALLTRALQGISTRTRYLHRNLRSIYKRGGLRALAARALPLARLP